MTGIMSRSERFEAMRKRVNAVVTDVEKLPTNKKKSDWLADMTDAYFDVEDAYRRRNGGAAELAYNKVDNLINKGYNLK